MLEPNCEPLWSLTFSFVFLTFLWDFCWASFLCCTRASCCDSAGKSGGKTLTECHPFVKFFYLYIDSLRRTSNSQRTYYSATEASVSVSRGLGNECKDQSRLGTEIIGHWGRLECFRAWCHCVENSSHGALVTFRSMYMQCGAERIWMNKVMQFLLTS